MNTELDREELNLYYQLVETNIQRMAIDKEAERITRRLINIRHEKLRAKLKLPNGRELEVIG